MSFELKYLKTMALSLNLNFNFTANSNKFLLKGFSLFSGIEGNFRVFVWSLNRNSFFELVKTGTYEKIMTEHGPLR